MLTIRLDGGVGNQLFQYAFIKSLAAHRNEPYQLDIRSYLRGNKRGKLGLSRLQVDTKLTSEGSLGTSLLLLRLLRKLKIRKAGNICIERTAAFTPEVFRCKGSYFYGYFQSYKYFNHLRTDLQSELKFAPGKESPYMHGILQTESVGIHVRKGDYVTNRRVYDLMVQLQPGYYLTAVRRMAEMVTRPVHLYLFSDDPQWVRQNLLGTMQAVAPCTLVQHSCTDADLFDLECMRNCRHQVISNSTFSWWAAYLNSNTEKTVIAPRKWYRKVDLRFDDLYPAGWIVQ